jgi:hypothetical protein
MVKKMDIHVNFKFISFNGKKKWIFMLILSSFHLMVKKMDIHVNFKFISFNGKKKMDIHVNFKFISFQ